MRRATLFICGCLWLTQSPTLPAQDQSAPLAVTGASGIRLAVDEQNDLPALRISLPGQPASDPGIFVVFPEHVTAVERNKTDSQRLYLFRPGRQTGRPSWRRTTRSLEYTADFAPGVRMIARATLEDDGVRYRYEFVNRSTVDYTMMQAVTDPRMISPYLRDVLLERTYVHHQDGFDLLASETLDRLTLVAQNRWLPNRHRVSYSWPVEVLRWAKQPDGVTWYNKSRVVNEPFIATQSTDGQWIMATFSRDPGNVWVNPELTCQHADPQISLPRGQTRSYELKTLLVQGTLDQVLTRVRQQRMVMKN